MAPGQDEGIRAQHPLLGMASVSLQVTAAAVARLVVEPAQLRLQTGEAKTLGARALYSDGTESDVTFAAQWMSLDQRVARVGTGVERPGLVTGIAGDTTVTAGFAGAASGSRNQRGPGDGGAVAQHLAADVDPPARGHAPLRAGQHRRRELSDSSTIAGATLIWAPPAAQAKLAVTVVFPPAMPSASPGRPPRCHPGDAGPATSTGRRT